jgi:pimeloyl-ACP methyl ester carboxylesterase
MKTRMEWLQGTARLAGDGLLGAVDAVEGVHLAIVESVSRFVPFGGVVARVTGFTYSRVRDVAHVTRRTAGGALALLERAAPREPARKRVKPSQLAWLSALNGAIGDHLESDANPLAIDMRLCRDGHELDPRSPDLSASLVAACGTLLVFVHGLGMNDLQWRDAHGDSFGARLEAEGLGHATYLRYNSGRRISANGRDLSLLLQALHEAHAAVLRRIVLVGHSMGGLVCRAACAHAQRHGFNWAGALDQVICLGTPHLGAPLERWGGSLSTLLAAAPFTRPLATIAEVRSAGVKDLREGWASDIDRDKDASHGPDLPFAGRVRWDVAAATLSAHATGTRARWIGDGLVPVQSALGEDEDPRRMLRLPAGRRHVFTSLGHMDLLVDARVLARLREWISAPRHAQRQK